MPYEVIKNGNIYRIKEEWNNVHFDDFPGNCGCGLMWNFGDMLFDKHGADKLKAILDFAHYQFKHNNNYGAIICVLGDHYYSAEKKLIGIGFERLKTYRNWAHGGTGNKHFKFGSQRCYILKIK